jgi:transcriptional regulator with XRE-family HTH domain
MTTASLQPQPWVELQVLRRKDNSTLVQLSAAAGIALGHLSDLENGKRRPTAQVIAKLAEAMNVPKSMLEPRAEA